MESGKEAREVRAGEGSTPGARRGGTEVRQEEAGQRKQWVTFPRTTLVGAAG